MGRQGLERPRREPGLEERAVAATRGSSGSPDRRLELGSPAAAGDRFDLYQSATCVRVGEPRERRVELRVLPGYMRRELEPLRSPPVVLERAR
jgi:hypothetical protein